jgi:DNA modification methylase
MQHQQHVRGERHAIDIKRTLRQLLTADLEFHQESSNHSTHDLHAFPAKFPPQLPRLFIQGLTTPGEVVLDPMAGSGTTLVESIHSQRHGLGFDIDPLAVLISNVKTTRLELDSVQLIQLGEQVVGRAERAMSTKRENVQRDLYLSFDEGTTAFLDYWFERETQLELMALKNEINRVTNHSVRHFLELTLSAIIITKSGGVSLAWDLAHTRPHKLKQGVSKIPRSALHEFRKRLRRNIASSSTLARSDVSAKVELGNAQTLAIKSGSIDLYFTSPPYASNAIDYMRASKFGLVWLGYTITQLTKLRAKCIGGESVRDFDMEELPSRTREVIERITAKNSKRGSALKRYYSEMTRVLRETHRVLKSDRAAVFVVGSAMMGGIDSLAQDCLAEIGSGVGFELVDIGIRRLDRNRRMLPVTEVRKENSQIENRMHQEYVLGFYKPKLKIA